MRIELTREAALVDREGRRVAYVVPRSTAIDGAAIVVDEAEVVVPIGRLPRTAEGHVDLAGLAQVPALDESIRARTEASLLATAGVRDGAVALVEVEAKLGYHAPGALALLPRITPPSSAMRAAPARGGGDRLALSDGGPAIEGPATLSEVLIRAAATDRAITFLDGEGRASRLPVAELLSTARSIAAGLRARGVAPGDAVLIVLADARSILSAFWGAVLAGAVPAIVSVPASFGEPSAALDVFTRARALLEDPLVVLDAAADVPRSATLAELSSSAADGAIHTASPGDTALYNLTSGSTGQPKCIALSHRGLLVRARGADALAGFAPDDVALSWLPFDHIGSISDWHVRPLQLGSAMIYAPKEWILAEPLRWLDVLDQHRVTATWAPNFAFQLLVTEHQRRAPDRRWSLSHVRCLLTAGESVAQKTVDEFARTFAPYGLRPQALVPAFGMAELGSGVTYARPPQGRTAIFHERDGASFADLGPPVPGAKLRVVDTEGRPLAEGVVGQVQIGGEVVAKGYHRASPDQAAAFLPDRWLDTGDRGFLEGGRLVLTGRSKDVIIVNGANYYAHEIEAVVDTVEGVDPSFTAAFAVSTPDERLAIAYVPTSPWRPEQIKAIRKAVVSRIGINPEHIVPLSRERIPKSAIGKIMRTRLRAQLERGELDAEIGQVVAAVGGPSAVPDWFLARTWVAAKPARSAAQSADTVLLLSPEMGLSADMAAQVAARLAALGRRVMRATNAGDTPASTVVALHGLDLTSDAGPREIEALLGRLREASQSRGELVVVTHRAVSTDAAEAPVPASAAIAGWTRALAGERPARVIDVALSDPSAIAAEIIQSDEPEVALRPAGRRIPRLAPLVWPASPSAPAIVPGGLYAITGATGGLGQLLCAELVRLFGVTVRPIDRAELASAERLEAAIASAEREHQKPLSGVFHLAGTFRESAARDETPALVREVFAGKLDGAAHVDRMLRSRPAASLVVYSTLAGTFGGARLGAYAAANAYADAIVQRQRNAGRKAWSIAWSAFTDVGLGKEAAASEVMRSRGYLPVTPARGLASLFGILAAPDAPAVVLAGVDRSHPELRWRDITSPVQALELRAFAVGEPSWSALAVTDRLEARHAVRVTSVAAIPRRDGRPDIDALLGRETASKTAPRTDVERGIAELWRELLGAADVSREDDFFALGGHSLLATQLLSRLRDAFGVTVPLGKLFEATTLAQMGEAVEALRAPDADRDVAALLDQVQHLSPEELERLLADDAAVTAQRAPLPSSEAKVAITSFGIITANRPEATERALDSYLANLRDHDRKLSVIVTDDSREESISRDYRARLGKLSRKYGVEIHYGWIDAKHRFIDAVVKRTGCPMSVARSGLVRGTSGVYACGVNRNSFQMATAGEAAFVADDDTVCRISPTPNPRPGAGIAAGMDGARMWFFGDREATLSVPAVPADLIGLHEGLLGTSPADLPLDRDFFHRIDPTTEARLTAPTSRIKMTIHGLLGDVGWAVPFGQWGAPMGYLLLDEESRERLVEDEATYRRALISRQILRVTDRVTITDPSYSMSTFWAFDNRTILAPHVTSLRGADLIFGMTLWRANPDAVFAHLPSALFHAPVEKREFHAGEIQRTALGFDATRLFINLMASAPEPRSREPAERLVEIGRWISEVGQLPQADFWALIAEQGRAAERRLLDIIRQQLAQHGHQPRWWADDLVRYAETLERSMERDSWFVPLDIRVLADSDASAAALTQRMVREQGELMSWWPAIYQASLELRREGVRIVEPLLED